MCLRDAVHTRTSSTWGECILTSSSTEYGINNSSKDSDNWIAGVMRRFLWTYMKRSVDIIYITKNKQKYNNFKNQKNNADNQHLFSWSWLVVFGSSKTNTIIFSIPFIITTTSCFITSWNHRIEIMSNLFINKSSILTSTVIVLLLLTSEYK